MNAPGRVVVVFDGRCGMCTRSALALKERDRRDRLELVPCQDAARRDVLGLTAEQCLAQVWAIPDTGEPVGGAQAMLLIVSTVLGTALPSHIGRAPGVRHALDFGYRWIASHRYYFPGTTPWCEQHPEQCEEGASSCRMPASG